MSFLNDAFMDMEKARREMASMQQMYGMQNQANGLAQALGLQQQAAKTYQVPNPEPNKVLLLLGDDE